MPSKTALIANAIVSPRLDRRRIRSTKSEGSESNADQVRTLMMGSADVGKSSIIHRLAEILPRCGQTNARNSSANEELHRFEFANQTGSIFIELLDTSGYQAFPAMQELAIRQAQSFILVCSLDDESSFEYVRELRQEVLRVKKTQDPRSPPPTIVVVVNKVDLPKPKCQFDLAYAELRVKCDWEDCGFVACSARNGHNICAILGELIEQMQRSSSKNTQSSLLKPIHETKRRGSMPSFLNIPTPSIHRTPSMPKNKARPAERPPSAKRPDHRPPGGLVISPAC